MHIRKILLVSLLTALYGCQPETPVQQETAMQPASAPVHAAVVQEATVAEPAVSAPSVDAPAAPPVKAEPAAKKALAAAPAADKAVSPPAAQAAVAQVKEMAAVAAPAVDAKPVVSEADGLALAKKNSCLACHAIDKKMVGPAWKAVAVKYRGDAGAEAHLVNKIAKGGSGVWGSMAMPGNSKISEADRITLARFVLNLQ
jgi:cytochrome c